MISRLRGTLVSIGEDTVEVATPSGVVYEVSVPLSVAERIPPVGAELEIMTHHLVREDLVALYGFVDAGERDLFRMLLQATGVGARLALQLLSTFRAPRLARAIAERDVAALVQAPGVGKKTAERLILELRDRIGRLHLEGESPLLPGPAAGVRVAVQALIALGMSFPDADRAVRAVLEEGLDLDSDALIRRALAVK